MHIATHRIVAIYDIKKCEHGCTAMTVICGRWPWAIAKHVQVFTSCCYVSLGTWNSLDWRRCDNGDLVPFSMIGKPLFVYLAQRDLRRS